MMGLLWLICWKKLMRQGFRLRMMRSLCKWQHDSG